LPLATGPGVISVGSNEYQTGTLTVAPTCSIASFGAVGDGVTDNATAIQNTFNYAATNHCIALIPAGTFAYSTPPTATGIAVTGTGAASILTPLDVTNEALTLTGSGGSISNLQMTSPATTRLSSYQSAMIWVNGASNYTVENVLINGSSSVGIFSVNSNNGQVLNNTVENTQADSISQIDGSYDITVRGNRILNSGDDSISNVSYIVNPVVYDITVTGNTILNQIWGQGVTVLGGNNITINANYVEGGPAGLSGIYIAAESEWSTLGVSTVQVTDNTVIDGGGAPAGSGAGAITVYNSQGSTYTITGVTLSGNQIVDPLNNAELYIGNGSETGTTDNNTAYMTGAFSASGNSLAAFTETNDQVLAPSAYTAPLVTPGGGCNFAGC
jgi:parallel beta-helix repeat protein